MQDLKRSRRRFTNKSTEIEEVRIEELERGCKKKHNECEEKKSCKHECHKEEHYHGCGCHKEEHYHECHKHDDCDEKCTPCEEEFDVRMKNDCEQGCCGPIMPKKFSLSNSIPYAIEVNRIFDTMKFQTFTDASGPRGRELYFKYEVVEVNGEIPQRASVNINIETISMNYSEIKVKPGIVTLENRVVTPLCKNVLENEPTENLCPGFEDAVEDDFGQMLFEYNVSGNVNPECCSTGEKVAYKERGLKVRAYDLVLELEGKCGCTDVVVVAYPVVKVNGEFKDAEFVEFNFNTLTAPCCLPANGMEATLRQQFQAALRVDCIGKALLRVSDVDCHGYDYEFCIPNGIDLVCCLEEVVSALVNEQIVVLGSAKPIEPRVVDSFSKVCDFTTCGDR